MDAGDVEVFVAKDAVGERIEGVADEIPVQRDTCQFTGVGRVLHQVNVRLAVNQNRTVITTIQSNIQRQSQLLEHSAGIQFILSAAGHPIDLNWWRRL